jgi:broad specificity phosphatase PhoE
MTASNPAARPDLKALRRRPLFAPLLVPLLGAAALAIAVAGWWSLQRTTTVIVVRHAEKLVDGSKDPILGPAGADRAARLAHLFHDAGIAAIYATEYKRTQQTAAPLALATGLPVNEIEAGDVAGLAERIQDEHAGSAVFVVGHSNTVGKLVQALGGEAPDEIADDDYDNIWIVTVPTFGRKVTLHLHGL